MTTHVQQTLPFPWQGGRQCSVQLLIQPWICAPGTHYGWVDRGSAEHEVCPILLHMASIGNRTPDLLILSPKPYPLSHMLVSRQGCDTLFCSHVSPLILGSLLQVDRVNEVSRCFFELPTEVKQKYAREGSDSNQGWVPPQTER